MSRVIFNAVVIVFMMLNSANPQQLIAKEKSKPASNKSCLNEHQTNDSVAYNSPNSIYRRMFEVVNIKMLTGKWQTIGDPKYIIEFQLGEHGFYLGSTSEPLSGFYFSRKGTDSLKAVGVLMRWPPSYCYVQNIEEEKLTLEFSGVVNQNRIIYHFVRVN